MATQFLRNRACVFHVIFLSVRSLAMVLGQTKWQLSINQILDSKKEDGKPLHFSYKANYFEDVVEPHILTLMCIWLGLGILLHVIFSKKRQYASYLIFAYELLYLLIEHNLPLDYGFDMPFAVTMRLLIIVTCFACQTGSCIFMTTLVYFIIVFLLQPMSRDTPNDFENSFDAIIGLFSTFIAATMVLAAY